MAGHQLRTLGFVVPAPDASAVRHALSALPGCAVRCCEPHPADGQVTLLIAFDHGQQLALMGLLMACVPSGQFGRIAPAVSAADLVH